MSRVGKKPISIPEKTKLDYKGRMLTVQGPKGSLSQQIHPAVELKFEDGSVLVEVDKEDKKSQAIRGLTRSLVANMIAGVDQGFERVLEIHGIGYRAEAKGESLLLNLDTPIRSTSSCPKVFRPPWNATTLSNWPV